MDNQKVDPKNQAKNDPDDYNWIKSIKILKNVKSWTDDWSQDEENESS